MGSTSTAQKPAEPEPDGPAFVSEGVMQDLLLHGETRDPDTGRQLVLVGGNSVSSVKYKS